MVVRCEAAGILDEKACRVSGFRLALGGERM
jgi:hypothetical protein